MSRFSADLRAFFFENDEPAQIRVEEMVHLGNEKIFGFLLAAIAFPCALPIPHFGISIPFGMVLALFAIQLLLGKHTPWLPPRFLNYKVSRETARKFLNVGLRFIERTEAIAQPRYTVLCTSMAGRFMIGSVVLIAALMMMVPFPGTNIPPAIGIFITGIGLLEEDGLISLVGLGICLLSVGLGAVIVGAVVFGGFNFLDLFHSWGTAIAMIGTSGI